MAPHEVWSHHPIPDPELVGEMDVTGVKVWMLNVGFEDVSECWEEEDGQGKEERRFSNTQHTSLYGHKLAAFFWTIAPTQFSFNRRS